MRWKASAPSSLGRRRRSTPTRRLSTLRRTEGESISPTPTPHPTDPYPRRLPSRARARSWPSPAVGVAAVAAAGAQASWPTRGGTRTPGCSGTRSLRPRPHSASPLLIRYVYPSCPTPMGFGRFPAADDGGESPVAPPRSPCPRTSRANASTAFARTTSRRTARSRPGVVHVVARAIVPGSAQGGRPPGPSGAAPPVGVGRRGAPRTFMLAVLIRARPYQGPPDARPPCLVAAAPLARTLRRRPRRAIRSRRRRSLMNGRLTTTGSCWSWSSCLARRSSNVLKTPCR